MIKLFRFATLLCLCFASFAHAQDELKPQDLLLTFIPNIQFSPFYVGIERGIFAEAGYAMSIEHLQEPEVLDLVAVGRANYGIVSGEQVILARSRGRDVLTVFEWFQQYPVGLVHASELDLGDLQAIRGLAIGIPGRFGASYSGLITLLHSAGLSEADIEIKEIGFSAPEVFCLGAVDAAVVYANNEPLQIRNLAAAGECGTHEDVAVLSIADQVDLVSNGLIVSSEHMRTAPDEIARMVSAISQALRMTIDNPAAAYLDSQPYVDALPASDALIAALEDEARRQSESLMESPSRAAIAESRNASYERLAELFSDADLLQFQVLLKSIEMWDAEQLGHSDLAAWQAMRDTLARMDMLGDELGDLSLAFSNDFLPVDAE